MWTLNPTRSSRITTATGAVIGLAAGAVALKLGVQHYGWPDVAAASGVGLAVGASIEGASIGLAAGVATGLLLWRFHPSVGPGGAVAWGLAGMAVGGLADWVADAVQGGSDISGIPIQFSIAR